jgi:hypothetical protein
MKYNLRFSIWLKSFAFALLLSAIIPQPSTLFAQGSLTPPGAPAPTMRTLTQIEPRTAIASTPFTISQPGSYYLSANLTAVSNAIVINANGVTLDLNGFTISSSATNAVINGGTAILINSGLSDLAIYNGHIRSGVTNNGAGIYFGPGFFNAIACLNLNARNVRVTGVSVFRVLRYGIVLGLEGTTVESCTVQTVGDYGIIASYVKGCVATDCFNAAIYGVQVVDSRGEALHSGINAETAVNSHGGSINSIGVSAYTAQNCLGQSSSSLGIDAEIAQNCRGVTLSGLFGLRAFVANNSYGFHDNNGIGLYVTQVATGCYGYSRSGTGLSAYIANSCRGATTSGTAQTITFKYNMP